jgi:sulfur carrier protein
MNIVINGEPHQVAEGISVAEAVHLLTSSATGVAVAVNGEVVRRACWPETRLSAGDSIEVITAVQGG